jgi:hypothetical protein
MYTLVTEMVAPRRLRAAILKDNEKCLIVEMQPYLFYTKGRANFTDVNVPLFIEMTYNTNVCSTDFVNSPELLDKFKEAVSFLIKSEYWNSIIIPIPAKELYDFYIANIGVIEFIEDVVFYKNDETINLVNTWEVKDALRIDNNKHYLSFFRKSKLDVYKTEWWNKELEIMKNEKVA